MAVECELAGGITTTFTDNDKMIPTNYGKIPAKDIKQGYRVCYIVGEPLTEVVSPPVVT